MYGDMFITYDQEKIDDICKKDASGIIEIINEDNVKICNVNNLYRKHLYIEDIKNLRIINCDLSPNDFIYIDKNVETCIIEDSTINIMRISDNHLKSLELNNCYIKHLDIHDSQEVGTIYSFNSIIDKLVIEHSTIMHGFIVNDKNRIKNLRVARSFIINLLKNSYNEIMASNIESIEDVAIDDYDFVDLIEDSVEIINSCIIEKDNDERYNFKRGCENEKD